MKAASLLFSFLLIATGTHLRAALPFVDNFGNGSPENSDATPGFWTRILDVGNPVTGSTITEDTLAPPAATTSFVHLNAKPEVHLVSSVLSDFNFFNSPLTFTVSGISFSLSALPPPSTTLAQEQFRFAVQSDAGTTQFGSRSAVALFIDGANNVRLGFKEGGTGNADTFRTLVGGPGASLLNLGGNGTITGFSLTLDASGYRLAVNQTGGTSEFSGAYTDTGSSLLRDTWNFGMNSSGDSALSFMALRDNNVTTDTVTVNIDQIRVVPEPSSIVLLAFGSLVGGTLASGRRCQRTA